MSPRSPEPAPQAGLIVVAAGSGTRLGADVRKALVELAGRPLVEHTLRRLLTLPQLDPLVLVGHPDDREALQTLLEGLPRPVQLVDGGARRQDSVAAGLAALDSLDGLDAPDAPDKRRRVVLVHDAARPFVPLDAIDALIATAAARGCALLAVPVTDTLKQGSIDAPTCVERTISRDRLWAAQTPQAFDRVLLAERLAEVADQGLTMTDEAAMFEAAGLAVHFVEGSTLNFKVTTKDDLLLARALLPRFAPKGNT